MTGLIYMRYELLRSLRNRRFFFLSLGFPLILFYVIASPYRHVHNYDGTGISLPLYYMVGLAAFGSMMAIVSNGSRIAAERQIGWTRQLRLTPLSTRAYFRAKVATGYMMALIALALLFAAGASLGVSMPAQRWLEMAGLMLVALLPLAALGIALGHLLNVDSLGPATGGVVSLLALLSGTWFPIGSHGFLHDLAQFLPSYWLVQASHIGLHGHAWSSMGWIVIAAWTAVLTLAVRYAFQRDTQRV
ncbi:MAG: ABC transporter permease [Solirubrobacteraceae bacterium]